MPETAERLFIQEMFPHAVEVMQHGHAAPTDPKCGMNIGLRPIKYFCQLLPIAYLFKIQMFQRRTSHYEAVEFFVFNGVKCPVELCHVVGSRVL